jgi:hypothetical protein
MINMRRTKNAGAVSSGQMGNVFHIAQLQWRIGDNVAGYGNHSGTAFYGSAYQP